MKKELQKQTVLMVASVASMIDQFNVPNIRLLISMNYNVDVACNFIEGSTCTKEKIKELIKLLDTLGVNCYQVDFARNPANLRKGLRACRQLDDIINGRMLTINGRMHHWQGNHYAFIHAHSPIGGVAGRLTAWRNGVKIVYTAHGFHFYHGAPLKNWLLYYPVEKALSWITDVIITINREDYDRACTKLHARKVMAIPGVGVDTKKFHSSLIVPDSKRKELNLKNTDIMLLSAGKNIPYRYYEIMIKAVSNLNNADLKYFIVVSGNLKYELTSFISRNGMEGRVRLLESYADISKLCQAADVFIFPSMQAEPSLMEAAACRTPVVCGNVQENKIFAAKKECLFYPENENSVNQCMQFILSKNRVQIKEFFQDSVWDNYEKLKMQNLQTDTGCDEYLYHKRLLRLRLRQQLLEKLSVKNIEFILLSVGELQKRKNQQVVIEALHRMKNQHILYLCAGTGELQEDYRKLISKYKLADQVKLLGFQKDIPSLCMIADCFIHTPVREGLGIAPLEAMASGLPLISSFVNGIKDYTRDGITGCCVDPHSAESVSNAIEYMYLHPKEREQYAYNNMKIARKYDISRTDKIMRKLYHELQQKQGRRQIR